MQVKLTNFADIIILLMDWFFASLWHATFRTLQSWNLIL